MKKILAAILALSFALSLVACGGKPSAPASASASGAQSKEPIQLSTVKITDSTMAFVDCTADDNVFQDEVLRDLNIDVTYKWIADVTQADAKFATMVASGDIPDYFNVYDAKLAFQLINDGYAMDITDVYEKTASADLKARDAAFPEAHDSMKVDGRLYGVSELGYGMGNELNILWVRTDWLKESGKQVPTTLDELYDLANYFMDNIDTCEYGITLSKDMTNRTEHTMLPLLNAYNAFAKIWVKDDAGKLAYSSIQPEMKTALAQMQQLYKEGVFSKEFSVKDGDAVGQDVAAGKVGIVGGLNWIGWSSLGRTVALDPNAVWTPIAIPTQKAGDPMVKLQASWPVTGYWLISKDCKNPEAVIELFNYFVKNEENYTAEKYNNAGGIFGGSPVYQTDPRLDSVGIRNELTGGGDGSSLGANARNSFNTAKDYLVNNNVGAYGAAAQVGPEGIGAYSVIEKYTESDSYVLTELRGAIPAGYAQAYGTLESLEDEYFTRIVMGEPIDLFDEFVQKWNTSGGESATQEMNDIYRK